MARPFRPARQAAGAPLIDASAAKLGISATLEPPRAFAEAAVIYAAFRCQHGRYMSAEIDSELRATDSRPAHDDGDATPEDGAADAGGRYRPSAFSSGGDARLPPADGAACLYSKSPREARCSNDSNTLSPQILATFIMPAPPMLFT